MQFISIRKELDRVQTDPGYDKWFQCIETGLEVEITNHSIGSIKLAFFADPFEADRGHACKWLGIEGSCPIQGFISIYDVRIVEA